MTEILYAVTCWVDPANGRAYEDWLNGGHVEEVAASPGVLWARKARLEQPNDKGWRGYLVIYCFESRRAFVAYRQSALVARFVKECIPFAGTYSIQRHFGEVDLLIESEKDSQSL